MDDIAPSDLTVVALRAALKKRGESMTGSKAALVKRLKCAIDEDASAMTTGEANENATASHDGVALIEAVHRGDVDAVRALVAAGATVGRSREQDGNDNDDDDDDYHDDVDDSAL